MMQQKERLALALVTEEEHIHKQTTWGIHAER